MWMYKCILLVYFHHEYQIGNVYLGILLYAFILIARKYKYYQKILSKHETIFAMFSYLCILDISWWRNAHSDNFIITQ